MNWKVLKKMYAFIKESPLNYDLLEYGSVEACKEALKNAEDNNERE